MYNVQEIADRLGGKKLRGVRSDSEGNLELLFEDNRILQIQLESHFDDQWLDVNVLEEKNSWTLPTKSKLDREIKNLYDDGNGFIKAIKYCRQETGQGLRDAKMYVEKVVGRR
jgi:hypothetical protein